MTTEDSKWDKIMDQAAFDNILNAAPVKNKWSDPMFTCQVMRKLPPSVISEALENRGEDGIQLALKDNGLENLHFYVMKFAGEIVAFSALGEDSYRRRFHMRGKYTVPEFRRSNIQNVLSQESLNYAKTQTYRIPTLYSKGKDLNRIQSWVRQGAVYMPGWEHPQYKEKDPNYYFYHTWADITKMTKFDTREMRWKFDKEILND